MSRRSEQLRAALDRAFAPVQLVINDESHLHAGHAGAAGGAGHFRVRLVSDGFRGLSRVARHRVIYQSVGALMSTEIHALSIEALTPEESAAAGPAGSPGGNP